MKKINIILAVLVVSLCFIAFEKEGTISSAVINDNHNGLNEDVFMEENPANSKSMAISKDEYMLLSYEETKLLWLSKLSQIKTKSINESQKEEINNLMLELNNADSNIDLIISTSFQESAFELLRLTSDEDYLLMFNSLEDYELINSIEYREDIESNSMVYPMLNNHILTSGTTPIINSGKEKPCNCNWTCGGAGSQCTHSNCEPTSSGCGFLWAFSCDDRDEIYPSNCSSLSN